MVPKKYTRKIPKATRRPYRHDDTRVVSGDGWLLAESDPGDPAVIRVSRPAGTGTEVVIDRVGITLITPTDACRLYRWGDAPGVYIPR